MGQYKQINSAKVLRCIVPLSTSESCLAFAPLRASNYEVMANVSEPQIQT